MQCSFFAQFYVHVHVFVCDPSTEAPISIVNVLHSVAAVPWQTKGMLWDDTQMILKPDLLSMCVFVCVLLVYSMRKSPFLKILLWHS